VDDLPEAAPPSMATMMKGFCSLVIASIGASPVRNNTECHSERSEGSILMLLMGRTGFFASLRMTRELKVWSMAHN
jgi:hypothetical protein